jgi:hypothetical protein
MAIVKQSRLLLLAAATCWIGWAATADDAVSADWAACQRKPTRACLLEEALSRDGAPLAGKDRLDVLVFAGAIIHPEYATAADIAEAVRLAKAPGGLKACGSGRDGGAGQRRHEPQGYSVRNGPGTAAVAGCGPARWSPYAAAMARIRFRTIQACLKDSGRTQGHNGTTNSSTCV